MTACYDGDLRSAKAAVADGASVNKEGTPADWVAAPPLAAAVARKHHDVVVWLLSHGADPNGCAVMFNGVHNSTADILQLLIDAGGDVNRNGGDRPPVFWAVYLDSVDKVRVLLAQPSLDFHNKYGLKTPEEYARANRKPALADMIAQEVSGKGCRLVMLGLLARADGVWRC